MLTLWMNKILVMLLFKLMIVEDSTYDGSYHALPVFQQCFIKLLNKLNATESYLLLLFIFQTLH